MPDKPIKILLATGIFYPDVGGPAIHVRKIAEALVTAGYLVVVVAYGDNSGPEEFPFKVIRISKKLPSLLRWIKYLLIVSNEAVCARILYAFNLTTAGIPVFIAGKLFRKKILIRIPGDPIWERIVEHGRRSISFVNYYKQKLYMIDRPWLFKIIRFILIRFDKIVLYVPFLSEIYQQYYNIPADRINIIFHPTFRRDPLPVPLAKEPTLLFAGRFVYYKNLELVIRAFDKVRQKLGKGRLILMGDGPDREKLEKIASSLPSAGNIEIFSKVDQTRLFRYICSSWVGIGPALTEFNPNFVLECLSFGKPVLLSRENGATVKLPEDFIFSADSIQELEDKLINLFNPECYRKALEMVSKLDLGRPWDDVIKDHLELIRELLAT